MTQPQPLDPFTFGEVQPCFGCSPSNPAGLGMRFWRDGAVVTTRYTPGEEHQGPPGILHGGLVTTLADELAAWTIIALKGRLGFTVAMEARFRAPIRIGVETWGRGTIERDSKRLVKVKVELGQGDTLALEGHFTFALLDRGGAERLLGRDLPDAWKKFCRDAPV